MAIPITFGTRPASAANESGPRQIAETLKPEVKIQIEDYAKTRSQFKTKLTRLVASPQTSTPVKLPSGETEIEYG